MSYAGNAFAFLVNALFGLLLIAILLRVLLQATRADFYNPICQFLVRATNPLLLPLRRLIPGLWGIDMAGVVLLWIVQTLELLLLSWLTGPAVTFPGVLLLAAVELVRLVAWTYIISILIQALLSWVNPDPSNPVTPLLWRLTQPVLAPFRQLIPMVGGIDLSPLVAILALQFGLLLILDPITAWAWSVAAA